MSSNTDPVRAPALPPQSNPGGGSKIQGGRSPPPSQLAIHEIPYGKWRDYDPEDTVRFYSLRMNEDWRFLNELKKELKG